MNAFEAAERIKSNTNLINARLRYCLVTEDKIPTRYDCKQAKPNDVNDFVSLDKFEDTILKKYAGLGISIQASAISAIDVDHCFSIPFDLESIDDRALNIIDIFKENAYIEFSFSGKGLRVLFTCDAIDNYSDSYYIKNTKTGCEFYNSNSLSYRYVTITGKTIIDHAIQNCPMSQLNIFLDKYMRKPRKSNVGQIWSPQIDNRPIDYLLNQVKKLYWHNIQFQDDWFEQNHYLINGESQESETDFRILSMLYTHITQDKEKLKALFEESPFFKTKDSKHMWKWYHNDFRYYNYIYECLKRGT